MPAVVRDSSWATVITVGAPQLVRLALEGLGLADCECMPSTAETVNIDSVASAMNRAAAFC